MAYRIVPLKNFLFFFFVFFCLAISSNFLGTIKSMTHATSCRFDALRGNFAQHFASLKEDLK